MKHKQAYIKLASLRLAINYVLRNRAMTKSSGIVSPLVGAGIGAGLGYLLNPHKKSKLWTALGGGLLGGAAGYGVGKAYDKYNKTLKQNQELYQALEDKEREQQQTLEGLQRLAKRTGTTNLNGKNSLDLISDAEINLDEIRQKLKDNMVNTEEPVNGVRWVTPKYDIPTVIPQETVDYFNSLNPEIMKDPDRYLDYDELKESLQRLADKYPKYKKNEAISDGPYIGLKNEEAINLLTPSQLLDAYRKGYIYLDPDSVWDSFKYKPQVIDINNLINKPVTYTEKGFWGPVTKVKKPGFIQDGDIRTARRLLPWHYFLSQADPEQYGFLMDPTFYEQGFESPIINSLPLLGVDPREENAGINENLRPFYLDWKARQTR